MDEPLLVRLPNIEGIEEVVRRSLTGSTDLTDGPGSDSWRSHMELGWYVTVPAGLGTEDAVGEVLREVLLVAAVSCDTTPAFLARSGSVAN